MIEDFFNEIAHNDFTRELSSELDNNKIRYVSESHAKEIYYETRQILLIMCIISIILTGLTLCSMIRSRAYKNNMVLLIFIVS